MDLTWQRPSSKAGVFLRVARGAREKSSGAIVRAPRVPLVFGRSLERSRGEAVV